MIDIPLGLAVISLVIVAVWGCFTVLWGMWKGVRGDLKRWKKMTEEEQGNFFLWTVYRVMVTVLILAFGIGAPLFTFFWICQEVLQVPALAGSPLGGVLRMEAHIPVLLP